MKKIFILNRLINCIPILFISMVLLSCNDLSRQVNSYTIPITFYKKGYLERGNYFMNVEYKNNNGNKLFIYKCEKLQAGVKILKFNDTDKYFYNSQKLELVDVKKIKVLDYLIEVKKFTNIKSAKSHDLSYFYLNDDYGLILTYNLNYDNIVEYDTERFKKVHQKIITDTLFFKESKDVIEIKKELMELNKKIN